MLQRLAFCAILFLAVPTEAAIYRWDNGELIAGTEDVQPGPGVQLESRMLLHAELSAMDLTEANFRYSVLDFAQLDGTNLTGAKLESASWNDASLVGVDLTGANLSFSGGSRNNLSQANLTNASLRVATLSHTNLREAKLTNANLENARLHWSDVTSADFTSATISGVQLHGAVGLTKEQIYSTASYRASNLEGIGLGSLELTGWNLVGQKIRFGDFRSSHLQSVDMTNSDLSFAYFDGAEIVASRLVGADMQNAFVRNSVWPGTDLTSANLTDAWLWSTDLSTSIVTDAIFRGATLFATDLSSVIGFTKEQLYSTLSYENRNLTRILLNGRSLVDWNFVEQNLEFAQLRGANLADADLTNAFLPLGDLSGARLDGTNLRAAALMSANLVETNLELAFVNSATYDQWTVFPVGFDPSQHRLLFRSTPIGDFDADNSFDEDDINMLSSRIFGLDDRFTWLPDSAFDVNRDGRLDSVDYQIWAQDIRHTWLGDANLDGQFNSSDVVQVFAWGMYEQPSDAGWSQGDWTGDGRFDTMDLIRAFQDGGFEVGPRPAATSPVPEPHCGILLLLSLVGLTRLFQWHPGRFQ